MQSVKVDPTELVWKLCNRLIDSGWAEVFMESLLDEEMKRIVVGLQTEAAKGFRFTPTLKQVCRAFEVCPFRELKVVIIGQDPYPQPGVADGIAFSCGNTGKAELSLSHLLKAVEQTVYERSEVAIEGMSTDLVRWSSQGVLLLNAALTTRVGEVGSHYHLWSRFIAIVLTTISKKVFAGIIFVFLGKKAEGFVSCIDQSNHFCLLVTHPASARYSPTGEWDCKNFFNEINRLLRLMDDTAIVW